jgi:hypothetical protein
MSHRHPNFSVRIDSLPTIQSDKNSDNSNNYFLKEKKK